MKAASRILLTMMVLTMAGISGCHELSFIWERTERQNVDLGVRAENSDESSASRRNTIGELSYYDGTAPLRVRGYGLVLGLGENGSRDCPPRVFKDLVQSMYKQFQFSRAEVGVKSLTPEQLINSDDTAVVSVVGQIEPGAPTGTPIDVAIMALPGTQTKSLWGGRLFPMELEVFTENTERGSITGRAMARAAGPLFINPFSDDDSATQSNARMAQILGGGVTLNDRKVRLVLTAPSYQKAKRIQDRINGRFPGVRRVADAISPSFIRINIPDEYHDDTAHFLALLRALYLSRDPRFETVQVQKLVKELEDPGAPHSAIALCLEGIGRNAMPALKDLYVHDQALARFYAAAAGLRLGDHLASDVMSRFANDPDSEFRFQAIRALGEVRRMGAAGVALRELLDDKDPRIRIEAYESLLKRGDKAVRSLRVGRKNYRLDLVPSSGEPAIYCKRSRDQRITLFGDMQIEPPVFYHAPDGGLMINALVDDEALTVVRTSASSGKSSPPLQVPFGLPDFVRLCGDTAGMDRHEKLIGLGMDYGAVVRTLYQLCQDGTIHAKFVMERPNLAELFGPPGPVGRPESESRRERERASQGEFEVNEAAPSDSDNG